MKKKSVLFFWPLQFYTIFERKSSNLRSLLSFTFPQGLRLPKKFGHWTLASGGKKTIKRSEQSVTDRQTHKTETNKKIQNP